MVRFVEVLAELVLRARRRGGVESVRKANPRGVRVGNENDRANETSSLDVSEREKKTIKCNSSSARRSVVSARSLGSRP